LKFVGTSDWLIVSLHESPAYNLSKYLADILRLLLSTSPHSAKNVNAFLSEIKDLHVEPDEIMISSDVVSLFTSIPLDIARLITEKQHTNYKIRACKNPRLADKTIVFSEHEASKVVVMVT
jgi:hypothetical protein